MPLREKIMQAVRGIVDASPDSDLPASIFISNRDDLFADAILAVIPDQDGYRRGTEDAAEVALALDSRRGNEAEIAKAIRRLSPSRKGGLK